MEDIAAYLLCVENGKEATKELMSAIIGSIKPDFSKDSLDLFLTKIEGKTYEEIITEGSSKMASQVVSSSSNAVEAKSAAVPDQVADEQSESDEAEFDLF